MEFATDAPTGPQWDALNIYRWMADILGNYPLGEPEENRDEDRLSCTWEFRDLGELCLLLDGWRRPEGPKVTVAMWLHEQEDDHIILVWDPHEGDSWLGSVEMTEDTTPLPVKEVLGLVPAVARMIDFRLSRDQAEERLHRMATWISLHRPLDA